VPGFNSSINGQLSLKYRFARALSRWDGEHPAIIEDEATYLAYRSRLNDSPSKAPGRTLVKENILLGIFKRLGLDGLAEENCCFVALTWDTRANMFFQSKDVPSDCLPVFLDSAGADVYSNSLHRVGWMGYSELERALGLADSPEYDAAFATMLDAAEPNEGFYTESRGRRWSSFPSWVVTLASSIANCFGSRSRRWEGSFSIQDENRQTIAKVIPTRGGVFIGVRDGYPIAVPPASWKSADGHITEQNVQRVRFLGMTVTSIAEATEFIAQLRGRIEPEAAVAESAPGEPEA
jgi:hypothetical protein